jgi:dethiobiotin synthase
MKNGHGIFITGTDTDIGKTYVCRILINGFTPWQTVTYMKPVQTGCRRDAAGILIAPDFEYVMQGDALLRTEPDDHVPYRFEPACSPHLAASRAGVMISLEHIREKFNRVSNKKSITIVEGAGGVLTPLSETTSMLDLIEYLQLPVVVVTSPRIGTINHTLLTIGALAKRGIDPVGLVFNNHQELPENFIYHDTLRVLHDHLPGTLFLELGYKEECNRKVEEFCHAIVERL